MNGNNHPADTNILLYIITGHKSLSPFINDYLFISEISEIELAATSIDMNIPLLTADKGFRKIKELNLTLLDLAKV